MCIMKKVCWRFDLRISLAVFATVRTLFWLGLMAAAITFVQNKADDEGQADEAFNDKDATAGINIHWIERAPTVYSCVFGLSAVLEVMLLIGCLVRLACPVVCWMCFALVVAAYFIAILVFEWQEVAEQQIVSVASIVVFLLWLLHAYCMLVAVSFLCSLRHHAGAVLAGPQVLHLVPSAGSAASAPAVMQHRTTAAPEERDAFIPSAPPMGV